MTKNWVNYSRDKRLIHLTSDQNNNASGSSKLASRNQKGRERDRDKARKLPVRALKVAKKKMKKNMWEKGRESVWSEVCLAWCSTSFLLFHFPPNPQRESCLPVLSLLFPFHREDLTRKALWALWVFPRRPAETAKLVELLYTGLSQKTTTTPVQHSSRVSTLLRLDVIILV